jgi:polysaccharide export outer membrane protein
MRKENGVQKSYRVNLCSAQDVFNSPAFYLKQNDIIYIEPNDTRARQSTVNGNNVRSTSFWLSVASFLTSIVLVFIR